MIKWIRTTLLGTLLLVSIPAFAMTSEGMLSGNLSSVGSDTLANLMSLWAEDFNHHYPSINLQIQAAGSSTAPTALAAGAAQLYHESADEVG